MASLEDFGCPRRFCTILAEWKEDPSQVVTRMLYAGKSSLDLDATARRQLSAKIREHLDKSPEIRPFPAAVSRLLAAVQNPHASLKTFEPIIESDPSLSIQVLRLANSPLFGLPKVNSIAHAVSLLGVNRLRTLGMSVAGATMFSHGKQAEMQRRITWNHSVGCAIVGRLLSEYIPDVSPEDAFLGGIFHDVGKLFFYDVVPKEYASLTSTHSGAGLAEEERQVFGTNHEEIGLNSAHSWQLPPTIKAAIAWHHRPESAPVHPEVAAAIFFADGLAQSWGIGPANAAFCPQQDVIREYGISDEDLHEIQEQARVEFDEVMQTWGKL